MIERKPFENHSPEYLRGLFNAFDEAQDWVREAKCKGQTDLFFPDDERAQSNNLYIEPRKICNTCPVRVQCLKLALKLKPRYGMWGGKSPSERREIIHNSLVEKRGRLSKSQSVSPSSASQSNKCEPPAKSSERFVLAFTVKPPEHSETQVSASAVAATENGTQ